MFETEFVLYQWPIMEKVEMCSYMGIPDSRCVYIAYIVDVVYLWVRRTSGEDDDNQWQIVGDDFIVRKGLATSSIVQIVREGEEPEQLWKHLHCFSFQNTGEKH
ncbi:uncharacterized protein LOC122196074 [Lactuca sativa]|uniref:uncharacterized protein LOC122196074 n=1 Tax=Lactuca sativa TaxID=4236 RepID=UPI001C68C9A6|nr:uncharacterized protein LOC122196074 [Lactuca sativa]